MENVYRLDSQGYGVKDDEDEAKSVSDSASSRLLRI